MSHMSLREYVQEIDRQIQNSQIEESFAHCRHILAHHPKYLPVYRLLGHACLEEGNYAYAAHFFQSVLSANPEDADAWMNLGLLSDDLGELEQAAWLMERAFEANPGSAEIRGLLRNLYLRRDGVERARIKLTAGALARIYAAGGFYERAIDELEKLLQDGRGLAPLHVAYLEVALAEALWHAEGMAPMADKVSHSLLEKLPTCLKANLILGQIMHSAGMPEKAAPYIDIARALDPEGRVAYDMFGDRSPIPLADIEVPYLEYRPEEAFVEPAEAVATEGEDMSWLERVGKIPEAERGLEPTSEGEVPEWLQTWAQGEGIAEQGRPSAEQAIAEPGPAEEVQELPLAEERVPGWLSDLQAQEAEPVVPDWLRAIQEESTAEEEGEGVPEVPDWLQELQREEEPAGEAAEPTGVLAEEEAFPDWLQALQPEAGDQAPEWLQSIETDVKAPDLAETVIQEEGIPDWLRELQPEEEASATEAVAPGEAVEEEGIPDWLRELGAQDEEATAHLAEEAISRIEPVSEEEIPDWLRELRPQAAARTTPLAEEAAEVEETISMEEAGREEAGLPDWLHELVPGQEALAPAESLAEEEIPDWLRELRPRAAEPSALVEEETAAGMPAPGEGVAEEEETEGVPDWLSRLQPEAEGLFPTVAEQEAGPTAEAEAEAVAEEEEEEGIPDWLSRLQPEAEGLFPSIAEQEAWPAAEAEAEAVAEEEEEEGIPDWLSRLQPEAEGLFPSIAEQEAGPAAEAEAEAVAEEEEEEGIPDWLSRLQPEAEGLFPSIAEQEAGPAAEAEVEAVAEEEEEAAIPDWLSRLQPEAEGPFPSIAEQEAGPAAEAEVEAMAEEEEEAAIPDWLSRLQPEAEDLFPSIAEQEAGPVAEAEAEAMAEEEAAVPDWLSRFQPEAEGLFPSIAEQEAGPVAEAGAEVVAEEEEAVPDWLIRLQPEMEELFPPAAEEEIETAGELVAEVETAMEEEAVAQVQERIEPEAVVEEEAAEIAGPEAVIAPQVAGLPQPVEGRPQWLIELEAEIGQETVPLAAVGKAAVHEEVAEPAAPEAGRIPTWLAELEQGSARTDLQAAVAVPEALEEEAAPAGPAEAELEALPDVVELAWYQELEQLEVTPIPVEEIVIEEPPVPSAPLEAGQAAVVETLEPVIPVEEAAIQELPVEPALIQEYRARLAAAPGDHQARMTLARAYLYEGALEAAVREYEPLIQVASLHSDLIADLERATREYPNSCALHHILGDVYMRAGKFPEALEAYKQALTKLS